MRSALPHGALLTDQPRSILPSVSVLMPVRNGGRFLAPAIESILAQTFTRIEFIIVDDGSTDGSSLELASAAARDGRLVVLKQSQLGIVSALEAGRSIARGQYIARMDADDIASPYRLAMQVAYLEANPTVVAVGGQIRIIDAEGHVLRRGRWPVSKKMCRTHLDIGSPLCHPATMMRADAVKACGGYRLHAEPAEDYDLWLRLAKIGDLANLREVVLHYRIHAASVTSTRAKDNAKAAALALLSCKFGERVTAHLYQEPKSELVDWLTIENEIASSQRMFARSAYLNALIRNGAIAEDAEFEMLLGSLADFACDPIVRQYSEAVSFMIIRGVFQIRHARPRVDSWRLLNAGLRYFPMPIVREVAKVFATRIRRYPASNYAGLQPRVGAHADA